MRVLVRSVDRLVELNRDAIVRHVARAARAHQLPFRARLGIDQRKGGADRRQPDGQRPGEDFIGFHQIISFREYKSWKDSKDWGHCPSRSRAAAKPPAKLTDRKNTRLNSSH